MFAANLSFREQCKHTGSVCTHLQVVAEMTGRQKRMLRGPSGSYSFVSRALDAKCSMDEVGFC